MKTYSYLNVSLEFLLIGIFSPHLHIFISQLNEVIGFTVSAKRSEGKWLVTCVAERQGERIEMATYSRRGQNPMEGMNC